MSIIRARRTKRFASLTVSDPQRDSGEINHQSDRNIKKYDEAQPINYCERGIGVVQKILKIVRIIYRVCIITETIKIRFYLDLRTREGRNRKIFLIEVSEAHIYHYHVAGVAGHRTFALPTKS